MFNSKDLERELEDCKAAITKNWHTRGRIYGRIALGIVAIGLLIGGWLTAAPAIRDAVFAVYAHHMAGEPIPFDPQYTHGLVLNPTYAWGVTTNSQWLLDKMSLIVPYFAAERVTGETRYPTSVFFEPYVNQSSFVVAGSAGCEREQDWVSMNERAILDQRWNDEADAFHTLVHELIHIQNGNFCNGSSESLESKTEAAAIEVMAGMCNWGDDLACKAFWGAIESLARRSLWVQAHSVKLGWLYDAWSDMFLRSHAETMAAHKTDRFWEDSVGERYVISYKYGFLPWRDIVLAGVWSPGLGLNTGEFALDEHYRPYVLVMPFDDTRALLGWLSWFAWIR